MYLLSLVATVYYSREIQWLCHAHVTHGLFVRVIE